MTTFNVCPMWASTFVVPSSKDYGDKRAQDYFVKFFTKEHAVCSCPAYRYSGEYDDQMCKHVRKVMKYGCFWMPRYDNPVENILLVGHNALDDVDITLFNTTKKNLTDDPCPGGCGMNMIEVTV